MVVPKYLAYRHAQLADPNPHVMRVRLGYVKGLSTNFTRMAGEMAVNLQTGAYTTTLSGLTPLTTYAVWLVDRSESDLIPPTPDTLFRLLTFVAVGPTQLLSGNLGLLGLPLGLTLDRVFVTPGLLGRRRADRGTVTSSRRSSSALLTREYRHRRGPLHRNHTTPQPLSLVPDLLTQTDELPAFPG